MSCYEWERGTLVIPTKEWAKFRTALIKAHNDLQLAKLEKAKRLHAEVTALLKGKRGSKREKALHDFYLNYSSRMGRVLHLVIEHKYDPKTRKPIFKLKGLPKKRDLNLLPTSKDCTLSFGEGSITLQNKGRLATWEVGENNHARAHAREYELAKKFFALLGNITWTRGTGGKFVGNDEYNRDNEYEGGGGNYVTAEFGPEVQKRQEAQRKAMRQQDNYYRSMFGGRRW